MSPFVTGLIVVVLSSSYLVEDARQACDEYTAAQVAASKGAPLMPGEVERRKKRCDESLGKAQISIQAETARKAAAALQQQQKKADSVMLQWAQDNQKQLLQHAQTVGKSLDAHSAELDAQLRKVRDDSAHLREQLHAARNDDDEYRRIVDKLKPYELERLEIEKQKSKVQQVRRSLDDAASKLGTLQTATDKLGEAMDLADDVRAGEYTKATQTVLSNLDEINDLRIDKVQRAIDENPWNTWDDLHRRLEDEGVLKKAQRMKSGIGVLKKVAAVKELYNEAVAFKQELDDIDADEYSPQSTKDASKAFLAVSTLLDKASDYMPDHLQNAVKGTAAALGTVNNVRKAVSKAEEQRSQGAVNPNTVAGSERTENVKDELRAPDSDGVLLLDDEFRDSTGVRVWRDEGTGRVYVKNEDGELEGMSPEEWNRRRQAIANYGELTDGQASKDDYERLVQGRSVKGGQLGGLIPKNLDPDSLNDEEVTEWIRHESAERAAAETAYTGAYSQAQWDALSPGEKLAIRNKWRELQELSRAAGRGDPTPLQFNAFLENEEGNRERLEEMAAQRRAEEEALAAADEQLDADGGTASDTDATFGKDGIASDMDPQEFDEQLELMADLLASGDDAGAIEIYQRLTGASEEEARIYMDEVKDEVAFQEDAEDAQGTTVGTDDEVPDLDELPDDDALIDEEGRSVRLDPDAQDPDDFVDVDDAVRDRRRRRDGVTQASGQGAWDEIDRALDRERRNRDRAVADHNRTVQDIERQTARNRANHQNTVREAFGSPPSQCPPGLIPCGCPETHDYVWCHPEIPGGCSQRMSAHDFPF